MAVEPDTVYLIPPKKYITIKEGKLVLSEYAPGTLNHPIDVFFRLPGGGEEGALHRGGALRHRLRRHQRREGGEGARGPGHRPDPRAPSSTAWPRSVINTGLADFVLSPEEIAEEVLNFSNTPQLLRPLRGDGLLSEEDASSEEETLSHIYTILKNASGIDFTYYKRSTILRRIERRMLVTHTATLSEFARLLGDSPEEVNILTREIFIGVTSFFGTRLCLRS